MDQKPSGPENQQAETKPAIRSPNPVDSMPTPQNATARTGDRGVSEESAALYLRGLAFQKEGSLEEAKKMYEAALRVSPNLASAWNNMGTIHMKERNYGSAIIAFQKALRIKPQDADPYYNLACLYALQKNVNRSLSYLRKAITVDEAARQWAMTDDDLKSLRGHSEFKEIVDSATDL
jgi:tetratricopeptide (TPR) repeat protein